ncbi:MAG: hypothetical protein Q9206_002943 [Seirophora lacunosa]
MIVPRLEPTPESSASTSFDPTELITINTAVHTLFYIIVGACVLARFYTTISTKRLGLEDLLPKFYKNVVKSAKTIISRTSTYHELDKLGRHKGTGGVERARRGGTDQRREDAAAESVALHRQYLGANGNTEVSVTASSGVKEGESRVRSWNGPGILKTVSLATWETPIAHVEHSPAEPSKAVLHSAGPQSIDD